MVFKYMAYEFSSDSKLIRTFKTETLQGARKISDNVWILKLNNGYIKFRRLEDYHITFGTDGKKQIYTCKDCGKRYEYVANLIQHMKDDHNLEELL